MGGSDDPKNLIELTREEHADAHLKLYETHGKKEDLGAYYLLTGQTDEAAKICSVLGCLLYTSPSPRDRTRSRMPSSA